MTKIKDDDIIISCDKKHTCYEHLHANDCLRAYRKECKKSEKYKSTLEKLRNDLRKICKEECGYVQLKFCGDCDCRYGQILNRINEVLNDNN